MMTQISTLAGARLAAPATSVAGEWRRYLDFLRRPVLPERASGPNAQSVAATGRLLLLDFTLMAVLMAVGMIAYATGVEFPQNELETLAWGIGTLALIVVFAPIMEEVMFRSWMSGRPGHILAVLALGGGALVLYVDAAGGAASPGAIIGLLATLVAAAGAIYAFRHRGALGWFARAFPVFFWLSALGFATIHIWNYTEGSGPLVFLLVIPQLVAGTIFGYARVHYGLWSAIALHMLHNGTAVALALSLGEVMG
jgi:membrane protease YdiL (CAAX protease family)